MITFDRILSVALVGAALAVASTQVYATFHGRAGDTRQLTQPRFIDHWEEVLPIANHYGGTRGAPVKMVVFSDYECPICRLYHDTTADLLRDRGDEIEVLHAHYPLPSHRFAKPAARAIECADTEGRLDELVNLFYEKQDSLGLKSWNSFAEEAGISNPNSVERCAGDASDVPDVEAGIAFGQDIGVTGTPSTLINGWLFSGQLSADRLGLAIDAILAGDSPV